MKALSIQITAFLISAGAAAAASAQSGLPQIVQLPDDDFVLPWGNVAAADQRRRPDFTIFGTERNFRCTLTGSFKPGSRMRDFYNLREFEQSLSGTIYFVQDAAARLNEHFLNNDLDWALLDCIIPEAIEEDDKIQERLDRAVERAERQRERRRARNDDSDD